MNLEVSKISSAILKEFTEKYRERCQRSSISQNTRSCIQDPESASSREAYLNGRLTYIVRPSSIYRISTPLGPTDALLIIS